MEMELSKLLTIVIPCKNEGITINQTLSLLNFQNGIDGVKVIVSDSSDDGTTYHLENRNRDYFNLDIIQGGLPSKARNNGAERAETPFVLFMDADMMILDTNLLQECMEIMRRERLDLLTTKVRTTNGKYNYVFRTFDLIQGITRYITPFCLGGFMLMRKSTFITLNGFDEEAQVAEDYLLSKQIKTNRFKVYRKTIFTLPRRFESKGLWYMTKLMIMSFLNRNNKEFFSDHNSYWK
jgi:glycosyltransferase involved in cell wall biosynthesis